MKSQYGCCGRIVSARLGCGRITGSGVDFHCFLWGCLGHLAHKETTAHKAGGDAKQYRRKSGRRGLGCYNVYLNWLTR
jgi:hypothetical protein